jgi:glyceraldehyde-3-phosphate dehydrogenase (NADP+)
MNAIRRIPDKELLNQDTYLVNGELKWEGQTSPVFSTISSTEKYAPTILGSIPFMGETEAMEAVEAASAAYNKDRDYGQL